MQDNGTTFQNCILVKFVANNIISKNLTFTSWFKSYKRSCNLLKKYFTLSVLMFLDKFDLNPSSILKRISSLVPVLTKFTNIFNHLYIVSSEIFFHVKEKIPYKICIK